MARIDGIVDAMSQPAETHDDRTYNRAETDQLGHAHGAEHGHEHGHGHGHGHQGAHDHHHASLGDFDWDAAADMIEAEARAHGNYPAAALEPLGLAPKRVLDVGSGPGPAALAFAELWPDAEVIAVDGSRALLDRAEQRAQEASRRLGTIETQFPEGLADLPEADLVWSANVIHHVGDQLGALTTLVQRLRPGGVIAIVEGGLPSRWIPRDIGIGRPGLAGRLDIAAADGFQNMRDELPGSVRAVEDWPSLLEQAGCVNTGTRTVLIDRPGDADVRTWLRGRLARHRDGISSVLDADDLATLDRLIDPTDPEGIDLRPDVFHLGAKSVHIGYRPSS